MIDTHIHILPGLDDGAPDDEAALEMARIAVEDGVTAMMVTPHMREGDYLNEKPEVLERVAEFRELLQREGVALRVEPGSEVHLGPRLVERIQEGRILTCGDAGVYLLLECPYRTRPIRLEEIIFELKLAGITPVLAHPERVRFFQEDLPRYEEALRLGALGQLTSSSLLGTFGKSIQELSEKLVRRRLVHVLGSDAHDRRYRPPRLAAARRRWAELDGEESARRAVEDWPLALLRGEPIEPPPPLAEERPPGLWERLFGRKP
ncbi:MAG: hypothetical protein KBD01_06540 [Acidobacteria bacterium]|nr:hypothetical protein [Acidobacteriota bacterium]